MQTVKTSLPACDISVVIPAFNASHYICETLLSIKNQTVAPLEILVIDDASTDNTVKIVDQFSKEHRMPITIHSLPKNLGIGGARQKGAELAKGDYVAYLSSDDYWMNTFLERASEVHSWKGKRYAFYSDVYYCDSKLNITHIFNPPFASHENIIEWALKKNMFVNFSGVVFPKWLFDEISFEPLRYGEDLIFLLDTLKTPLQWYQYTYHPLIYYRVHKNQGTFALSPEKFESLWEPLRTRLIDLGVGGSKVAAAYQSDKKRMFPPFYVRHIKNAYMATKRLLIK